MKGYGKGRGPGLRSASSGTCRVDIADPQIVKLISVGRGVRAKVDRTRMLLKRLGRQLRSKVMVEVEKPALPAVWQCDVKVDGGGQR